MRRIWLKLHLWLWLILGLWLSLIGLTSSLLVFYHELEELVQPTTFAVAPQPGGEAAFRPFDEVYAAIRNGVPDGVQFDSKYFSMCFPLTMNSAWWGRYEVQTGSDARLWCVFADLYTVEVLARWQLPLRSGKVLDLSGHILVLLLGLALQVLFVTGAIHWLQKRRVAHRNQKKINEIKTEINNATFGGAA